MKAKRATAIGKARVELVAEIQKTLRTAPGVKTDELARQLAVQIANLQLWNKADDTAGHYMTAVNLLVEMKPETATEAMLGVQMVGAHHLATMSLVRANADQQSFEGIKEHTLLATRLMRLFNDQRLAQERQSVGRFPEGASVRSKDTARHGLPVSSDAERTLSTTWRSEHRPKDSGWD